MPSRNFSPLISVVLTTKDRPRFLSLALAYYRYQTYSQKELIVIDDGEVSPADPRAVKAAGGRLVRVGSGTPLGAKLNVGIENAKGAWCQKMDDDDWYAPDFLSQMAAAIARNRGTVCRPVLAFIAPFLFFDVAGWKIRRSTGNNLPGATLLFERADAQQRPFRPLPRDEDVWFLKDQISAGSTPLPVHALESFLAVRHSGGGADRDHTWIHQSDGRTLETYLAERPLHRSPEGLLPDWALAVYSEVRRELAAKLS